MRSFFEKLPEAFSKFGAPILNDKNEIVVKKRPRKWSLLTKRAASYFDIMLTGKNNKEYASTVFWQLYSFYPREGNSAAKGQLMDFLARMDHIAPEIMTL